MINLKSVEIENNSSFLNIYKFDDTNLLDRCIEESKDKLEDVGTRKVSFFSDFVTGNYMYGNVRVCKSQKLTPALKKMLDFINERFNSDYNGIIINYYKNGSNYIEKHSDSQNHPPNGVLLISYGSLRNFRIFDKITDVKVKDIPLVSGEMIHMGGNFQSQFTHDVEKDETITTERYSISLHKYMGLGLYD
jgi:alkylated DNA repair dioxygenase AlkB